MPFNTWRYHVPLRDLLHDHDVTEDPFEPMRDAVAARLRAHPFYTDHETDIVMRGLVRDLGEADTVEAFNRELNYLYTWADQEHTRVWLCTLPDCARCSTERDHAVAAPANLPGFQR